MRKRKYGKQEKRDYDTQLSRRVSNIWASTGSSSNSFEMRYEDNELIEEAVIKKYLITASDGKFYNTKHYNLQAIIAVGFKVNNDRAVRFRKWAGQIVKDYTIQGWTMDKERLKRAYVHR